MRGLLTVLNILAWGLLAILLAACDFARGGNATP